MNISLTGKVLNHELNLNAFRMKLSWKMPEKLMSLIRHAQHQIEDRAEINHHAAEEDFRTKQKEKLREDRKWIKKSTAIVEPPKESKGAGSGGK